MSPEEASMPSKLAGAGTVYVAITVVEAVLRVVVEKTLVVVTLLVTVDVKVVEYMVRLVSTEVIVVVVELNMVVVVAGGVIVLSGVETERTTISSGGRVVVDDVVGIAVFAEVAIFVTHFTVDIVVELSVIVKESPATIDFARVNKRSDCNSNMRGMRESRENRLYVRFFRQQTAF